MACTTDAATGHRGAVVSARAPAAARVGRDILDQGGNAVDAAVGAALCAAVVEPAACGIGGYGTHVTLASADNHVTCIDANSIAPQAAHPDMFGADATGQVPDQSNAFGWLAVGVPGTLAGLQLALDRYGTKTFAEVVAPAIDFARRGFDVGQDFADSLLSAAEHLRTDPASQQIYFKNGRPLRVGDRYRNPDLAALLDTLAESGSVESFYRGDIARQIASEFQNRGGVVTDADFAAYRAREVKPVEMEWNGYSIHTAPLTAGGLSTLQALSILKAVDRKQLANRHEQQHAVLEALRLAWSDRFLHLGDPDHVDVPVTRLLDGDHAGRLADRVLRAVKDRARIELQVDSFDQSGTVHISSADRDGNLVALTLTHGGAFGACVTVNGLGLTLGHGLSRFDPRPGHANSIAAHKRPLNNMTPTAVLRDGQPVLALGGRGGRRIPSALVRILLGIVAENRSLAESIDMPRMHTEGGGKLILDGLWSEEDAAGFAPLGYAAVRGEVACVSAVSFDPATGSVAAVHR